MQGTYLLHKSPLSFQISPQHHSYHSILTHKWASHNNFLETHNMQVQSSPNDGYCFIHSVIACLTNDYGDTIMRDDIFPKIISHLCDNYGEYVNFHTFDNSHLQSPFTESLTTSASSVSSSTEVIKFILR